MLKLLSKKLPELFVICFILLMVFFYYASKIHSEMHKEVRLSQTDTIIFTSGSSIRTLANQLIEKDLLTDKRYLLIWGKVNKQATKLQAGEYLIAPGSTLVQLLDDMVSGKVVQHEISLIEGFTFRQILQKIYKDPVISKETKGLTDEEIMTKLGHAGEHPEGRFYPDKYYITRGITDLELLARAYQAMEKVIEHEWQKRAKDLPYKSPYEALIMASIVEKESAIAAERSLIAGLFVNRLRIRMRLETDPTVIYGIENYDGNIRRKDLRKDTPYNTYTRYGLPPTPIAMPGKAAINASLHPDATKYLYFVAYGDGSGRHVFSTNLKDHEKAVDKYQRKR